MHGSLACLLDLALPRLCPACHRADPHTAYFCLSCRRRFKRVPHAGICFLCRTRGRSRSRSAGAACREPGHEPFRGRALFWMGEPLDAVVHVLKYGGRRDVGIALGRILGKNIPMPSGVLGVPVPLHPVRLRERGYNQAGCLLTGAVRFWTASVDPKLLVRTRRTRSQAKLALEDRGRNTDGAFRSQGGVAGRDIAVVDDVCTSGSTLVAATTALLEGGVRRVLPVALALA